MTGQVPGSSRIAGTSITFRVGWWVLLVLTALFIVNHLAGTVGFAALGIVSLSVLLIPYRARESWAWWVSWAQPLALAVPIVLFRDGIGVFYLVVAVVMAVAQLATLSTFRAPTATRSAA
jgi:hypothetical protein